MPKPKPPRKKHNKNKVAVPVVYNPWEAHGTCSAEVRYGSWGPHQAQLWCLTHDQHIQWLTQEMAPKWEQALKTAPGISSQG